MIMNKALSSLLVASTLCASSLFGAESNNKWAVEASDVCVNLYNPGFNPGIEVLPVHVGSAAPEAVKKELGALKTRLSGAQGTWYAINLPIEIKAIGRKESDKGKSEKCPARFVDELTIKAYVLFEKSASAKEKKKGGGINAEDFFLLEKEVTYVNIPMEETAKKGGDGFSDVKDGAGFATMSVGLFLSPIDAMKLSGNPDKFDGKVKAVACAIEPSFKGVPCRTIPKNNADNARDEKISDNKLRVFLEKKGAKWWKGSTAGHYSKSSAKLLSIAETPFAASYAPSYPEMKPLFGEVAPKSAAGGTSTTEDGAVSATDSTDSTDTTDTTTTTTSSSKSKRSSSSKSRASE